MAIAEVVDLLRCPRCTAGLAMADGGRSVRCPLGHSYDLARQGQLNLLGTRAPRNADTAAMVEARDRFLAGGHYRAIADQLLAAVEDLPRPRLLDVGAGTGYYLRRLLDELPAGRGVAVDVSVAAARRAARSGPRLGAVVADAWQGLPLGTGSCDLVLDVFAPRNPAEFHRVLSGKGRLVTVTPTPDHLTELRGPLRLLEIQPAKQQRLQESLDAQFTEESTVEVRRESVWDAHTLQDLVSMGPSAFHLAPAEVAALVGALSAPVTVTVAVAVTVWTPRP